MQVRRRGSIVLVSSIAGKVASPGGALYSATKYGLRGFGLGLRLDLAADGVGVTVVFPGFIRDAGMFAEAGVKLLPGLGTKSPAEVARAVLRAVHDNPAEIDVASVEQRVGAVIGALSPSLSQFVQTRFGGLELSRKIAAAQRNNR
jgi:short-subunit dehydrogenase